MTRKPIIYTADAIRVDGDEGRYGLIIDTDEGDKVYVDIHGVVLDFYAQVRAEIRPYVIESDHARAAVARGVSRQEYLTGIPEVDPDAYSLNDPKHPTYHERMVD